MNIKNPPSGLLSIFLSILALFASQVSAWDKQDAPNHAADTSSEQSRRYSSIYSPRYSTPGVVGMQLLSGAGAGTASAVGTAILVLTTMDCDEPKKDDRSTDDDDESSQSGDLCLGPVIMAAFLGTGAYVAGSALGVYVAGRVMNREGAFWATFLGATAGAALGAAVVGVLASSSDGGAVALSTGFIVLTQVGAVGAYHLSDRVRISAALENAPRLAEGPSGSSGRSWSIRPELKVVLARF